jgi:hypothetical protein
MTKEQFLSGNEFMYDNEVDTCFKYKDECIYEIWYFKGQILNTKHHANIKSIGTKYFTYYTFVLGKKVSGKINFLNL